MHANLRWIKGRINILATGCGEQPEASRFASGAPLDDNAHILHPPHHNGHGHGFPDCSSGRIETQRVEPVTVRVCLGNSRGELLGIARHNFPIEAQVVIAARQR